MSREPFLRFALIVLCISAASVLWLLFGWEAVIFVMVGLLAAAFLSVDYTQPPPIRRPVRDPEATGFDRPFDGHKPTVRLGGDG